MTIAFLLLIVALCTAFACTGVVVYLNWAAGKALLAIYRHEADPELAQGQLSVLLGPALRGQAVLFDEGGRASLRYTSDVLEQRFGVTSAEGARLPTGQIAGVARANLLELVFRSRGDALASGDVSDIYCAAVDLESTWSSSLKTDNLALFVSFHVRLLLRRAAMGDPHALAAIESVGELLEREVAS